MKDDLVICPVCKRQATKDILNNDNCCVIGILPEYVKEVVDRLGKKKAKKHLIKECIDDISKKIDMIVDINT